MTNRLKLNFQIDTAEERKIFIDNYVRSPEFEKKPLTEDELEMCANYILWGKDNDGKNVVQRKEIQIKTKNGTWDKQEDESLDGLLESPTFTESQILGPGSPKTKVSREVFSRKRALAECPPQLVPIFEDLFYRIDRLDLILNYYDLAHNKRKNPPREELLQRFTPEEQRELEEEASHYNQFKYLKMRHFLVELRREQFTLKDTYSSMITRHTPPIIDHQIDKLSFDSDIEVFPLGLKSIEKNKLAPLLFRDDYVPTSYTEEELKYISDYLWNKKMMAREENPRKRYIDFTNLEHVYNLFLLYFDLEDEAIKNEIESETDSLLATLKFYIARANLTEIQEEILDLKTKKRKNQDIAEYINKKYGKSYSANYISTIFRQKIIKQINDAAIFHVEIISNLFFPENFKICSCCGLTKLKDAENFVRKSRSKDGFSNCCKVCDKEKRNKKKEAK